MKEKVEIKIEEGHFHKSHKGGRQYTSVGYNGKMYGGGFPCITNEQVRRMIKHAEERIKAEGDISFINWGDVKPIDTGNNLMRWI